MIRSHMPLITLMVAGLQMPVVASKPTLLNLVTFKHNKVVKASDEFFIRIRKFLTEWENLDNFFRQLWSAYQTEKTLYLVDLYKNIVERGTFMASPERQAEFDAIKLQLSAVIEVYERFAPDYQAEIREQYSKLGLSELSLEEKIKLIIEVDINGIMAQAREGLQYYQKLNDTYLMDADMLLGRYATGVINKETLIAEAQALLQQYNYKLAQFKESLEKLESVMALMVENFKQNTHS